MKELELVKSSVVVTDELDCDECAVHMGNLATLQSKYARSLEELAKVKARPVLLGACKSCSCLQTELAEKNAKIALLEKANSVSTVDGKCALCEALEIELGNCRHAKKHVEKENTYLRTILSWVSCNEPQLGMMVSQFRRRTDGSGLGFALCGKDGNAFGKVGEASGMTPSEKNPIPLKLTKFTPPKQPQPIVGDGVIIEPPKAPPVKKVWAPKPNHLRNSLDTLPNAPKEPLPKVQPPPRVNQNYKKVNSPPKVRYHCEYCKRNGHLVGFCFRRKKDERHEFEVNNWNTYRQPHGVHVPPVERRFARPRGAMPQGTRPLVARPRGGRARRSPSHDRKGYGHRVGVLCTTLLADYVSTLVVIAFLLLWDMVNLVLFLALLLSGWDNTGILPTSLTPVLHHTLISCLIFDDRMKAWRTRGSLTPVAHAT